MHSGDLGYLSIECRRLSPSSRLVCQALHSSRCNTGLSPRTANAWGRGRKWDGDVAIGWSAKLFAAQMKNSWWRSLRQVPRSRSPGGCARPRRAGCEPERPRPASGPVTSSSRSTGSRFSLSTNCALRSGRRGTGRCCCSSTARGTRCSSLFDRRIPDRPATGSGYQRHRGRVEEARLGWVRYARATRASPG